MNKLLFLFLFFLIFSPSYGQEIKALSIDHLKNDDFSTCHLQDELSEVKVIALGESSHWMGETYRAKVSFLKYLHQHHQVNTFAFESGFYDMYKVNEKLQKGEANRQLILRALFGTWHTTEMLPLYDYILASQKTANPIQLIGTDCQSLRISQDSLPLDLERLGERLTIEKQESNPIDSTFIKSLKNQMRLSNYFKAVPLEDTLILNQGFTTLLKLMDESPLPSEDFLFWKQMIKNLQSDYRKRYFPKQYLRDRQMADNILFWSNQNPKDKIGLWAASSHLIYGTEHIDEKERHKLDKRMGTYLRNSLGKAYYFVAFTAHRGKIGFPGYLGLMKRKIKSKKGTLERFLAKTTTAPYSFISFRKNSSKNDLLTSHLQKANLVWARSVTMNIPKACDAVFFIQEEKLVELIE
ncbi:MAG: erythromycin esterase family protein [Flavobacteriales bacterium]|nr:erythromycin esterase family protein [Flavobacteriales bacterium]